MGDVGLGELAGLGAALAWAANGLLVRAHGALHAIVINALRCSLAAAFFLLLWPFVADRQAVPLAAWMFLGLSLVVGLGIGDSIYFDAVRRIGVARAMSISMAYPVLTALLAVVLLGESLSVVAVVGIALALGGVYLVARPSPEPEVVATRPGDYWRGVLMACVAALGWTCSTLSLRPALELVDVPTASAIRMPLVGVLLWVTAARSGVLPSRAAFTPRALLAILGTAVVTVLATLLYLVSVALAGAGRAAVLTATSPLFAVPFSVVFLGEHGGWRLVIGAVCTVVGVALLTLG